MFTLQQIHEAHNKVKSGADFPNYIQNLKQLGVLMYQTYVSDGHSDYHGENNYTITSAAKYDNLTIASKPDSNTFKSQLLVHQQGKTDYLTFIKMCAETGIEKWEICFKKLTCTYFDKNNNSVLTENIPQ
jgi:uncharacterized protein YbcV (DUF1398 family)